MIFFIIFISFGAGCSWDNGFISGTIRDASTSQPITEALVSATLASDSSCTAAGSGTTDSSGNYTIPNLKPGAYTVRARKQGYQTSFYFDETRAHLM